MIKIKKRHKNKKEFIIGIEYNFEYDYWFIIYLIFWYINIIIKRK